jgi:hypothetical protein
VEMASAAGKGPRRFAARTSQGAYRQRDRSTDALSRKLD